MQVHLQGFRSLLQISRSRARYQSNSEARLVVRGRFKVDQIKKVTTAYVKEYVLCHSCHLHKTHLVKKGRLLFVACDLCHTQHAVPNLEAGFVVNMEKSKGIRLKGG